MAEYNPAEIEARWQAFWEENQTFRTPEDPGEKKFYCLDMFPYPSGAGLHVGHPLGYTATACIHPSQVEHIRAGYRPSEEMITWARKVVDGSVENSGGVFSLDGQMIDGPVLRQAEIVLSRVAGPYPDPESDETGS